MDLTGDFIIYTVKKDDMEFEDLSLDDMVGRYEALEKIDCVKLKQDFKNII